MVGSERMVNAEHDQVSKPRRHRCKFRRETRQFSVRKFPACLRMFAQNALGEVK